MSHFLDALKVLRYDLECPEWSDERPLSLQTGYLDHDYVALGYLRASRSRSRSLLILEFEGYLHNSGTFSSGTSILLLYNSE